MAKSWGENFPQGVILTGVNIATLTQNLMVQVSNLNRNVWVRDTIPHHRIFTFPHEKFTPDLACKWEIEVQRERFMVNDWIVVFSLLFSVVNGS